jgi:tetrahydromethanopterin S-methyltransferase subunit G
VSTEADNERWRGGVDQKLDELMRGQHELNAKFDKYVSHPEFRPVRNIVYGLVAGILLSVLTAVLATVVSGG